MSLYARLAPRGPLGLGYISSAEEVTAGLSLAGRTILVTGCNSGLGMETLRVLALRGAHVIGAARCALLAPEGAAHGPASQPGIGVPSSEAAGKLAVQLTG